MRRNRLLKHLLLLALIGLSCKQTTSRPPVPAQVENISITQEGSSLSVSWDSAEGANEYELLYGTEATLSSATVKKTSQTSYRLSSLTLRRNYYLKVRGINSGGSGEFSSTTSHYLRSSLNNKIVHGYITTSRGGASLEGATVTAAVVASTGTIHSPTSVSSDSAGQFFFEVEEGAYTVTATKSGHASSKVQEVYVRDQDVVVHMVQAPAAFSGYPVIPPEIVYEGVSSYQKLSDASAPLVITASSPDAVPIVGSDIRPSIALRYTSSGSSISTVATTNESSLAVSENALRSLQYNSHNQSDEFFLEISVYDANYNQALVYLPVTPQTTSLTNSYTPGKASNMSISIESIVYGTEQAWYSQGADSSVAVSIEIGNPYLAALSHTGVNVYRSEKSYGDYTLIGASKPVYGSVKITFEDTSPQLFLGNTYYYKFSYYNETARGELSSPVKVVILPKYQTYLVSPEDNANQSGDVTFTWRRTISQPLPAGASETYIFYMISPDGRILYSTATDTGITVPSSYFERNIQYSWGASGYLYLNNQNSSYIESHSYALPTSTYRRIYINNRPQHLYTPNNGDFYVTYK